MKQKQKLSALLRENTQTANRISEMYPADWEMEAIFRRSLRKYRRQMRRNSSEQNAVPAGVTIQQQRRFPKLYTSTPVTAVCLMLTVGIAGAVAWIQLSVQEPESVTEPVPSATSAVVSERPEESVHPQETVASQTDEPIFTEENSVRRESGTETVETVPSPSGTDPAPQPQDSESAAADLPQETAFTQQTSERRTVRAETVPIVTETNAVTTQPPAQGESYAPVTTFSEAVSEAVLTTTSVTFLPEEGASETISADAPIAETVPPSDETNTPSVMLELLDHLDYTEEEIYIRFTRSDSVYYPAPEEFSVMLEGYTATVLRSSDNAVSNQIENAETGVKAWVVFNGSSYSWQIFKRKDYPSVEPTSVNGETAYLLHGERISQLIWYDGRYLCTMYTDTENIAELGKIAESMMTYKQEDDI